MVASFNQIKSKLLFSFQFKINDSAVYLEHVNRVVKLVWEGRVEKDTAEGLLTYAADLIEGDVVNRIMLDQQNLIHFDYAARQWIKEKFLPNRQDVLLNQLKKVAVINECSVAALLYGDHSEVTSKISFDRLPLQKFDQTPDAESWLME